MSKIEGESSVKMRTTLGTSSYNDVTNEIARLLRE